jgi:hypothetical protein
MQRPRRYTDQQLEHAVAAHDNMHGVLKALGLVPRGGNYESVRHHITRLGIHAPHLEAYRRSRGSALLQISDHQIQAAIPVSRSFAELARNIGIHSQGRVQARLKARVLSLGYDTSHFTGAAWRRGATTPMVPPAPLEHFLVEGRFAQTSNLKRRLIQAGLREERCEICSNTSWNGAPIPLELDHINGRRIDNRLENLRLLCPNCHAQTDTYRGRNIGNTAGIL